jgi:hypothetical protein
MATYCYAFNVKAERDVTKGDYIRMCAALSSALGVHVGPEAVSEGGLRLRTPRGVKCLRHNFHLRAASGSPASVYQWPTIVDGTEEMWRGEEADDVLVPKGARARTFLKALADAPVWTKHELRCVQRGFDEHGFKATKALPNNVALWTSGLNGR